MKEFKYSNEDIRLKIKDIRIVSVLDISRSKRMEDFLIEKLEYLVYSVIRKYKQFDNYDDLYQEGMIGLVKAVRKYNPEMSFHFVRYAIWWIKARVMRSIKKINLVPSNNEEISRLSMICSDIDDDYMIESNESQEKELVYREEIDNLNRIINNLPPQQQELIKLRYGLNIEKREHSLGSIGKKMCINREEIRVLETQALSEIKDTITESNNE